MSVIIFCNFAEALGKQDTHSPPMWEMELGVTQSLAPGLLTRSVKVDKFKTPIRVHNAGPADLPSPRPASLTPKASRSELY